MKSLNLFICLVLSVLLVGCSNPTDNGGTTGGGTTGGGTLTFSTKNAKVLFAGPAPVSSRSTGSRSSNNILLKEDSNGDIVPAVTGLGSEFNIFDMEENPVTGELVLSGIFTVDGKDYGLIYVGTDDKFYVPNIPGFPNVDHLVFDKNGANYFTANESDTATESQKKVLYKCLNGTTYEITKAEIIYLKKVMLNGCLIAVIEPQNGSSYLFKPDGSFIPWGSAMPGARNDLGVYCEKSDTFYYGDKGYNFATGLDFESGVTVTANYDDIDAKDGNFLAVTQDKVSQISINNVNADGNCTLAENVLISGYTIDSITYGGESSTKDLILFDTEEFIYFVGKKEGEIYSNIYKCDKSDSSIQSLLDPGLDDNDRYLISSAQFKEDGSFLIGVQSMTSGDFGSLKGDWGGHKPVFSKDDKLKGIKHIILK